MRLWIPGKLVAGLTSARFVRLRYRLLVLFLLSAAMLLTPEAAWASGDGGGSGLISAIGISIMAATGLAYLAYLTKQPLLLAYLAAMAEPDWENAMQEYLDHLANLEHAVANRLSEKVCFFKRCLFEDAGSQWRACSGEGSSLRRAKR